MLEENKMIKDPPLEDIPRIEMAGKSMIDYVISSSAATRIIEK
jgi:hypothetical protein